MQHYVKQRLGHESFKCDSEIWPSSWSCLTITMICCPRIWNTSACYLKLLWAFTGRFVMPASTNVLLCQMGCWSLVWYWGTEVFNSREWPAWRTNDTLSSALYCFKKESGSSRLFCSDTIHLFFLVCTVYTDHQHLPWTKRNSHSHHSGQEPHALLGSNTPNKVRRPT